MKKYLLIIAALFLVSCGDEKEEDGDAEKYWVKNTSAETQKINGKDYSPGKCGKVSSFPFTAGAGDTEYGKDAPGHYTYDGMNAVKVDKSAVADCPEGSEPAQPPSANSGGVPPVPTETTTPAGTLTATYYYLLSHQLDNNLQEVSAQCKNHHGIQTASYFLGSDNEQCINNKVSICDDIKNKWLAKYRELNYTCVKDSEIIKQGTDKSCTQRNVENYTCTKQ